MSCQPTEAQNQLPMKPRIECPFEFTAVIVSHGQEDLDEFHFNLRPADRAFTCPSWRHAIVEGDVRQFVAGAVRLVRRVGTYQPPA